jgi:hypothetical protein
VVVILKVRMPLATEGTEVTEKKAKEIESWEFPRQTAATERSLSLFVFTL